MKILEGFDEDFLMKMCSNLDLLEVLVMIPQLLQTDWQTHEHTVIHWAPAGAKNSCQHAQACGVAEVYVMI